MRKSLFFSFLTDLSFFLYVSEKVFFNLLSANCSHSLCTTTLPPGIPVLQSLETSFLRWGALGDSFGPGIAHITAILNLTKPDCSKRTFGLGEIGYSSSSISLRLGLDGGKRQLFMFNSKVGQSLKCFWIKQTQLNGLIMAIRRADEASWMWWIAFKNK